MVDFHDMIPGYYTTLALQYGYTVFFSAYFPLGCFVMMIINIGMVGLTAYGYSNHAKRSSSTK